MIREDDVGQMQRFIEALWQHYIAITPDAARVHDLLCARGEIFSNGALFEGFVATSADKIFESTDVR